jgi:16S rRNA processing protein RimM
LTEKFIHVGTVSSTWGLKGFLKVRYSGDIFREIPPGVVLYADDKRELKVSSVTHKTQGLSYVLFEGYEDINIAEKLLNQRLYIPEASIPNILDKEEYFEFQLLGLKPAYEDTVYSNFTLASVIDNPAHPILSFVSNDQEILVPYIRQYIGKVDLEEKTIEVLNWKEWFEV